MQVTTNDCLLGSIESLECIMIESMYQAKIGNLRRSSLANRRAMSVAQLMGIHRPDYQARYQALKPSTKYDTHIMWFRIVFLDRYLCLFLGLSQGCLDQNMPFDPNLTDDTPLGSLERKHCAIASRILERNESKPGADDLALMRELDLERQRAARSLPSKWWLAPSLDVTSTGSQALFWSTCRLFAQVLHYNLLNQLHLPYMLRSSSTDRNYVYSLIVCMNASREVLSRFITLRSFDGIAYSCRTVDFLALMAALTLLLAHLDNHRSEAENLLAHQYHSDRAMIEQVLENMKEVNKLNLDMLSAQSVELLEKLLNIEVESPEGESPCAKVASVQDAGSAAMEAGREKEGDDAVSVHIPYFGFIIVAREGISKEVSKYQGPTPASGRAHQPPMVNRQRSAGPQSHRIEPQTQSVAMTNTPISELFTPSENTYDHTAPQLPMPSDPFAKAPGQYGMPSAGTNDARAYLVQKLQNDL